MWCRWFCTAWVLSVERRGTRFHPNIFGLRLSVLLTPRLFPVREVKCQTQSNRSVRWDADVSLAVSVCLLPINFIFSWKTQSLLLLQGMQMFYGKGGECGLMLENVTADKEVTGSNPLPVHHTFRWKHLLNEHITINDTLNTEARLPFPGVNMKYIKWVKNLSLFRSSHNDVISRMIWAHGSSSVRKL